MTSVAPRAWLERPLVDGRVDRHNLRRARPRVSTPRAASGGTAGCRATSLLSGETSKVRDLRVVEQVHGQGRASAGSVVHRHCGSTHLRRLVLSNAITSDAHGSEKKNKSSPLAADPARGGGVAVIATEEDADLDASSRLCRLKALVARKRLYFAILEAVDTSEGEIPTKGDALEKIGNVNASSPDFTESLGELAHLMDSYEDIVSDIESTERQIQSLDRWRSILFAATKEVGGDLFGLGDLTASAESERLIDQKVNEVTKELQKRSQNLLSKSLPYKDLETTKVELKKAQDRLLQAAETTGKAIDKLPRPVVKTVERVGSKAKSARGLIKTGVSNLREKPLTAAASAAEYTKGVWNRLNGGMDGFADCDPRIAELPRVASLSEERATRVLALTLEVQDCDKELSDASIERDKVMGSGKDSLSRVRLAKSIRERDDQVRDLRRVFAVRTLQLEMERILMQLEEEACLPPSLETPDRADEVELLNAEFGAMDLNLRKLAFMVDTESSSQIEDEDLTELATDIPDLKSRLGIVEDGMSLGSLSPQVIGERVSRTTTESLHKAQEAAEFMGRGVKMLGGDISASARFFGRAVMGSTLRPREVQTIRRTTLDIFTFVPFVIILIIPLTPVGHVLIFSFIQRYFPALFPSQFSGRRQELMKKYEELSLQLKEAERSKELREEDEALARAVTAVESLMMGGASDAEVAKAARAATAAVEGSAKTKSNSFFKLKGLERMASGEEVVDVKADTVTEELDTPEPVDPELETLRKSEASMRSTLSFHEDEGDAMPESR